MSNKVFFAFCIILATTLNFGFFIGDMNEINHHNHFELFFAIIINLIAMSLKLGTKTQIESIQLATSLVSCLQLIVAAFIWFFAKETGSMEVALPSIVSLSGGAFLANLISVILLVVDAVIYKR